MLSEPIELFVFGKDAGINRGDSVAVVFPQDTAQVVAVVRIAASRNIPIVARGAGTGLAGGAVPAPGSLLLVLTEMNAIEEVNVADRTAWVQPGVINLDLSNATSDVGLYFAPDPSSQSACTIGGNVANNAGGPHCLAEAAQ